MGCMGNIVQDRTGLLGCSGAEPKAGKGRGLGDMEEEKVQKKRGINVNSGLVGMLAWLCPASDQRTLPCLLTKFLSISFLGEGLSILRAHVCMGVWMPAAGVTPRLEGPCVRGASHWSKCRCVCAQRLAKIKLD